MLYRCLSETVTGKHIMEIPELDRYAWDCICRWPEKSGYTPEFQGYDIPHMVRCFLWAPIGRAIRIREGVPSAKIEQDLLQQSISTIKRFGPIRHGLICCKNLINSTKNRLVNFFPNRKSVILWSGSSHDSSKITGFVPLYNPNGPMAAAVACLMAEDDFQIIMPREHALALNAVYGYPTIRRPYQAFGKAWSHTLLDAIICGLECMDLKLLPLDIDRMRSQFESMAHDLPYAETLLLDIAPDFILVHGDNHPSHHYYVWAAKKHNIPSIMMQHGLDCERFYLDIPYAEFITVWGKEREQRYRPHNRWTKFFVTGNPRYDSIECAEEIHTDGDYWLWVGRPHSPEKCYAASRTVTEGLDILDALLCALDDTPRSKLVIKPHPYDKTDWYLDRIRSTGMIDRVTLNFSPIIELLKNASIVFSEDSTAGLEAMFFGKPLVHVHMCDSPPVMPFVAYGAALPGFTADDIRQSIRKLETDNKWKDVMRNGQRYFIKDFAGKMDGESSRHFVKCIRSIFSEGTF